MIFGGSTTNFFKPKPTQRAQPTPQDPVEEKTRKNDGWLVVLTCFNHVEKYEFVNGKDDNPYMKYKIKNV